MRAACLSLVILLVANAASAQGTIAGCVRDKHRGRLPGVEVIASGQTSQTRVVTDGSGCFQPDGLPAGRSATAPP